MVGGEILANGAAFPGMKVANSMSVPQVSPTYAYVMQDDAHFPLFTVKETLEFAAMLRQRTANVVDVQDMVAETLNVLGLRHISDHYVGTIGKSMISRGQLRRLTVGVEVVHSPSMIFCDEPTTGTGRIYYIFVLVLPLSLHFSHRFRQFSCLYSCTWLANFGSRWAHSILHHTLTGPCAIFAV